jgi:hypothetical protein
LDILSRYDGPVFHTRAACVVFGACVAVMLRPGLCRGQEADAQEDKRILWIIPNYRTSPTLKDYTPLTTRQKFGIAAKDSFDRGTFVLAALFAGEAQFTGATPSFGHGIGAYARYAATSYSDLVIGNFMTEAAYPTVLRQDPRYFRRGTGSGWSRLGYAVGQIFWTHTDAGGTQFNFSEIVGNSTAVAIGNAYYPDNRNVSSNLSKFGLQIGVDATANILKEFWPDLERAFSHRERDEIRMDGR